MDTCKLCGSVITERYFRVRSQMCCAGCAKVVAEEASRDPTPFILKGIVYAFLAACAGASLRAVFEGVVGLTGDAAGLVGMFLRWFVLVTVATFIIKGAKAGSSGRGGLALQVPSAVFSISPFHLLSFRSFSLEVRSWCLIPQISGS